MCIVYTYSCFIQHIIDYEVFEIKINVLQVFHHPISITQIALRVWPQTHLYQRMKGYENILILRYLSEYFSLSFSFAQQERYSKIYIENVKVPSN